MVVAKTGWPALLFCCCKNNVTGGISYDCACGVLFQWDNTIKWFSYPLLPAGTIQYKRNVDNCVLGEPLRYLFVLGLVKCLFQNEIKLWLLLNSLQLKSIIILHNDENKCLLNYYVGLPQRFIWIFARVCLNIPQLEDEQAVIKGFQL